MKILYAIQGTGNGHIARALDIIPILKTYGDVDIVLSGTQCDIDLPWAVKYRFRGASFVFGKKGGIDFWATLRSISLANFILEMFKIPLQNYDLIMNDFEPVVAWASKLKNKECIGVSHQSAVLHKNAPTPNRKSIWGKNILKYYAPSSRNYGFHFKTLGHGFFTPIIREDIRKARPTESNHYTVYLPAYSDEAIVEFLLKFPAVNWQVFSKHNKKKFTKANISVQPVDKTGFAKSMLAAKGVLCNAGFETPAETLYLKKKLCVIPMLGQYEQQCNAAMLATMGVPIFNTLKEINKAEFDSWLNSKNNINVDYKNDTDWIISSIIKAHVKIQEEPAFAI